MAVTVLSDFSAALSLVMRQQIVTQINSVAVIPYLLPITRGEGQSVNWTVKFSGAANAVASAEGATRSSADADDEAEVRATLPWAQYDKTSSVSDLAAAAGGSNYNPESISSFGRDVLLGRVIDQGLRMALGVANDCYAGNPAASPPQLAGAALAIDSSGTFAGINPATFTEWASVENTAPLASASFALMTDWFSDIYDACGYFPEFVTCPTNVFNTLKGLFTEYEANVVRAVSTINQMRGGGPDGRMPRELKMLGGFRAFEIEGIPFVLDRHATANTMYAWNTAFVEIQQLDPIQSILDGGPDAINELFSRLAGTKVVLPRADVEGMMATSAGLRPHIKMLGNRGLSTEAVILLFAQIEWKRRNAFGKFLFT